MITVGVFTHDFFPIIGGQGKHLYELFKQNEEYKKIKMLVFSPAKNTIKKHIQIFPETRKSKLKNIDFSVRLHFQIEELIAKYKLDIVHLHGGPGGLFLLKKLSIPTVFTSHHTYWQQYKYINSERWKYIFFLLEKQSYKNADRIICVSTDTKKNINKFLFFT